MQLLQHPIPACSAVALDAPGGGVLRLTDDQTSRFGFAVLNTPLNSLQGFNVSFDMFQYGTATNNADGIGFILIDGSYSPAVTGAGGGASLGYGINTFQQDTGQHVYNGINGGYLGVGFDVFGNYSTTSCATGLPNPSCQGYRPNGIAIRGPVSSNYALMQTVTASGSLNDDSTTTRTPARRTVTVSVSPSQVMSVKVDYHDGRGAVTELSNVDIRSLTGGTSVYPSTFKIGFSGSTGSYVDYHEIRNLVIQTLDPDLITTVAGPTGPLTPGSTADVVVNVRNLPSGAPTIGTITSTTVLPNGIVPTEASGAGWACTVAGQTVTCTRPGSGPNALGSGASTPPITIKTDVQVTSPTADMPISTSVTTTADANTANNTANTVVSVIIPDTTDPEVPNTGMPNVTNMVIIASIAAVVMLAGVVVAFRRSQARR